MWMTLGIIFILFIGMYSGARRGLVLQLILTVGYALSYYFASQYYLKAADHLKLLVPYPQASLNDTFVYYDQAIALHLDDAFYNGISFLLLLGIGWLLTRFVGGLLNGVTALPIIKQVNKLGGAVLGGVVSYVAIFLLLFILTMLPLGFIQEQFAHNALAQSIVEHTPKISHQIYEWWVNSSIRQ